MQEYIVSSAGLIGAAAPAAPAQGGPGGLQQLIGGIGPFILIFIILYLLLIRPQHKKAQEHREMVSRLKAGDRVVTNGGIHGVIASVKEKTVMLRVADNVEIEIARAAIGTVLPAPGAAEPAAQKSESIPRREDRQERSRKRKR